MLRSNKWPPFHGRRVSQAKNQPKQMVSYFVYTSALKMETIYSSGTSGFLQTTNPKGRNLRQIVVFWVDTLHIMCQVVTSVSQDYAASVLMVENEGRMFLRNYCSLVTTYHANVVVIQMNTV